MKLVLAVLDDEDANTALHALNKEGFSVTKLCSTGGFLKAGNTTLVSGVDESQADKVIETIKAHSRGRKIAVDASVLPNGMTGMYMPYPQEVMVGGATIFVLNVDHFEKV